MILLWLTTFKQNLIDIRSKNFFAIYQFHATGGHTQKTFCDLVKNDWEMNEKRKEVCR